MAQDIDDTVDDAVEDVVERTGRNRTVTHNARIWLGKPVTVEGRTRVQWVEENGEIEVVRQQYGQTGWFEELEHELIETAHELLEEAPPGYDSVRLRVVLYTHHPDGKNYKFTLEHIERPPFPTL